MKSFRKESCAEISPSLENKEVTLAGWADTIRDHGGVLFIDLRDRSGSCQVVLSEEISKQYKIRPESVLKIVGIVHLRPESMVNSKKENGDVEVIAQEIEVLSLANPLPFSLDESGEGAGEDTRLKYRYLDLRRKKHQKTIQLRHQMLQETRSFFSSRDFSEIETPYLYKSTPEGARDFLIPSRVNPGKYFALPQSPQTLKQLLMVSGFERYFQIVRCFRDEDLRADRQPEFTQLDLEMSFLNRDEILKIQENYVQELFQKVLGVEISAPFQRISYADAMMSYGSDKPDLRYDLKISNSSEFFKDCGFKVFSSTIQNGGVLLTLPVRSADFSQISNFKIPQWSRKELESFNDSVTPFGLRGVAWIKIENGLWKGPITKFFDEAFQKKLNAEKKLEEGDFLFFVCAELRKAQQAAGQLRTDLAKKLDIEKIKKVDWAPAWVLDFPLFHFDGKDNRFYSEHHPFTQPHEDDLKIVLNPKSTREEMQGVRADAYDLALNGYEVAGGSLRIYDTNLQSRIFEILGLSPEEIQEKFGFFVEALSYGTPPHGGIAYGFDRMAMLMAGETSIREVIAFPKTASATCLMSRSPNTVSPEQLAELKLRNL